MDSKKWWQSKAIWGGILASLGAISSMCIKGRVNPEDSAALIGALLAIYGRLMATTLIS